VAARRPDTLAALDQRDARIRFDWGPNGLRNLAPGADAVVIVDVLRFTSAVDVAASRGAWVFPYRWADDGAAAFARDLGAELAVTASEVDEDHPWSLSPVALDAIPSGTRLVLPSPNGAALAFGAADAGARTVVAGCLRNAVSVGSWLAARGGSVAVVAAGERWRGGTGPLRPAVEDLLGAGAILAQFAPGDCSPEARAAVGAFDAVSTDLEQVLLDSGSGRQLRLRGLDDDVISAARYDASRAVPVLDGGAFADRR
jgi:2-phosphosulfolactate phosphatase